MKQKLLYILNVVRPFPCLGIGKADLASALGFVKKFLIIILTFSYASGAWADTGYVISPQGSTEITLMDRWSSGTDKSYSWDGPGKTLSFDYKTQWSATGKIEVYATDKNGTETKLDDYGNNSSWGTHTIELSEDIRKIRFHPTGTERKYIRNVEVTRATTLSVSSSSPALSFGTVHRGNDKTINAKVDWNNTTYNQNLTGSGPTTAYAVTTTTMGEYGTGKEVPVVFTAGSSTALGSHNGNVTLTMAGKSVTIAATANVVTTYYGKATATASAGGSAYVSFTSYDAATATSATTNTANTSNASESKTAYYKATVNTGYRFLGWIKGTAAYSADNIVSTSLTYNPSITYSSESSGSPTETTYKAWFAPIFYFSADAISSNGSLGSASASVTEEVQGVPDETTKTVTATFTATTEDGCTFNGWYEASDYSGTPVSMNTTYTRNLTDNNVSSTTPVSLTLYAWFKKNPNLQWADPSLDLNLVQGTTGSSAAIAVDDGITITYTSSNTDAVTIDADGTIHAVGLGNSTVTARVGSDFTYNAESISRDFSVGEKKQATFTPAWGEGTSTDIKVGANTSIALTNIATDETFTISASPTGIVSWSRNGNTLTIHGDVAGTTTLTLAQDGNTFLYGNTVSYEITVSKYANPFALDAESKAMKVGDTWTGVVTNHGNRNVPQVSYSVAGIVTYDAANNRITANAEGSTVVTFTQAATDDTLGIVRNISVSVTKVENTLSVTLPSLATEVGGTITATIAGRNNTGTDIVATITTDSISPVKDDNYGVITYANGVITARNAGRARITFSQAATAQYTGYESETYEVNVSKISNSITITLAGGSTTNIKLKYNATASLNVTATNTETSPVVTRVSGSYTTYSSGTITAGNAQGTDIYEVTQAETYKYETGFASFTIRVNNTDEAVGYVLDDATQYSHGTGSGVVHTYTLSGPGETIYYSARTQNLAIYYNLYVEYSTDNENWTEAQNNQSLSSSYQDFSCAIPEEARYIRFRFPAGGTLTKYIKDVKVTRKTYVRASSDKTDLGTLYTDQTQTASFTVNYSSTNGGNINISTNNDNFVPSATTLNVANNSDGTKTFTVTYTPDPDHLGAESAVITIADLFYTEQITLNATSRKYATTIQRGSNTATETTVEGTIANAFAFTGTTTTAPSDDSDDDFYYTISHTQTSNVNNGDEVISYNPSTNTVTGLNQGTARLTVYQKKTNLYHATSQTFDFTVTKLANNIGIALSATTLNVDGTATVTLTNDDSKGGLSAEYSNITYTNVSQNREGGLLSFDAGTKILTGVNAGTGKVTLTQAETYKYVAKSAEFSIIVNKLPQTLTWDDPDLETGMQLGTTLSGNTATSDAELTPVTYASSNTAAITVNASTGVLTAVAIGSNITITASQAGNYKYLPATLTRQFSVFNKQVPTFVTDAHFTGTNGRVEFSCTATITVTGVSAGEDFSITNGDNTIINVVRNGEAITITGLAIGSTTLTLAQEGNEDYLAKTQTYNIEVYMPDDFLTLSPAVDPDYTEGTYRKVFLNRILKAGYSTIALPFNTSVEEIVGTGYDEDFDWVAQLQTVTYNQADGYTLYFNIVDDGVITANQPYVLHLQTAVPNPTWTNVSVLEAEAASPIHPQTGYSGYAGWSMVSNYTVNFPMDGKYGIVNSQGGLMLGSGENAKLNAYSAYITAPSGSNNAPRLRVAYVAPDGTSTMVEGISFNHTDTQSSTAIYSLDGRRRSQMQRGVNIVRQSDGTNRKVFK